MVGQEQDKDIGLEGLAHDLNNVFETISEAAEILSMEEGQEEIAAAIRRSVERGRRITGSIAQQARAPVAAAEPMEWAAGFVRDLAKMVHSARFTVQVEADGEVLLPGPAEDWERVFMNLFLNAMQATKGSGKVTAAARGVEGAFEISVADNGPGIPEEILPKLLRSRVSTRGAQGGLGLSIVGSIVRRHGGSVAAENGANGGARFLIRLPQA